MKMMALHIIAELIQIFDHLFIVHRINLLHLFHQFEQGFIFVGLFFGVVELLGFQGFQEIFYVVFYEDCWGQLHVLKNCEVVISVTIFIHFCRHLQIKITQSIPTFGFISQSFLLLFGFCLFQLTSTDTYHGFRKNIIDVHFSQQKQIIAGLFVIECADSFYCKGLCELLEVVFVESFEFVVELGEVYGRGVWVRLWLNGDLLGS